MSTKNEVATTEEHELNPFEFSMDGLDDSFIRAENEASGLEDLKIRTKIPFAKFFAKTYKGKKAGFLVLHAGTDHERVIDIREAENEFSQGIQILNIAYQRVYFDKPWNANDGKTAEPACKSYDNLYGAEGMKFAGRKCDTCPLQNWDVAREEGGEGATPPCRQNILLLILVPGEKEAFHLQIKGTNIKSFNEFGSSFKKFVDKQKTFPFAFNLGIQAKTIEHSYGDASILTFHSVKGKPVVSKEEFERAKDIHNWYREDYIAMMREASLAHQIGRDQDAEGEAGAGETTEDVAPF